MTRLHLIRHGTTAFTGQGYVGRAPGHSLDANGHEQAARLAAHFAHTRLAAILASPQPRARETAAPLARAQLLPVTIEPRLDEFDTGDWTGARFDDLAQTETWPAFLASRAFSRAPNGESMPEAAARAGAAIADALTRYSDTDIALVTHADIIRPILLATLGLGLAALERISIDPASRSTIQIDRGHATVVAMNVPA